MSKRRDSHMLPEQRQLRARIAANAMHARHDSRSVTRSARKAFLDRFDREVDPNEMLPPQERARRADQARRSYFGALALKSAQVRRRPRDSG